VIGSRQKSIQIKKHKKGTYQTPKKFKEILLKKYLEQFDQ
jgi:hypothetical protein